MKDKYGYKIVISAVIFNKEGKVLLAKRSLDEEVLPGYWGIPGGKAETREDTKWFLESELKREIKEEIGITIKDLHFIENHLHGASGKVQMCFMANMDSGNPKALEEVEEVNWFGLEEMKKMQLTPMTLERVKLAYDKKNYINPS